MIQIACQCGVRWETPETQIGQPETCPGCGRMVQPICGEALPEGGGAGDFDACLIVLKGPQRAGERLLLGGVAEIHIGKLPDKHIALAGGSMVSRLHCKLARIDFGPSRWRLEDNHSTNGLFVNGQRVQQHELKDGDIIRIGEYELRYSNPEAAIPMAKLAAAPGAQPVPAASAAPASGPRPPVAPGGPTCPSCQQPLAPGSTICIDCGIYIASGRPLLTAKGLDEDLLYERTETWVKAISWLVGITPMPIPVASEAYGAFKAYTIWALAALTVFVSIVFFVAYQSDEDAAKGLMLWPPNGHPVVPTFTRGQIRAIVDEMDISEREQFQKKLAELHGKVPDQEAPWHALKAMNPELRDPPFDKFAWWQLLTHALLHDPGGILALAMHLGGNMLFMLVFGTRVNALIGNVKMAILYPLLAVAAGVGQLLSMGSNPPATPLVGASGAIMGLAGMYLILFPVHRVYCAMWVRVGLLAGFRLWLKIFAIRGFWVLLIYFAYDLLMGYLTRRDTGGGVAHFAHIGGFVTGMLAATALLFSRLTDARGGDLFSLILGKRAWALLGKPSRRHGPQRVPAPVPAGAPVSPT